MIGQKLFELCAYSHSAEITSACIRDIGASSEIIFVSNNCLFFAKLNSHQEIEVSLPHALDFPFNFVTCSDDILCVYDTEPVLAVAKRDALVFRQYSFTSRTVLSAAVFNGLVAILDISNVFNITLYDFNNPERLKPVYRRNLTFEVPYKLISAPLHNALYIIGEGRISKITSSENGFLFDSVQLDIKDSDPLIVDAAPLGVQLLALTAGGIVIKLDGLKPQKIGEAYGAMALAVPTLNKCFIGIESDRIKLVNGSMEIIDELDDLICRAASYRNGSFVVASGNSVRNCYYDYGLEIEHIIEMNFQFQPNILTTNELVFIFYENRSVVLSHDFKDVTPSFMRKRSFERVHVNSSMNFFAISSDTVFRYDHGSVDTYEHQSTLSAHHHSTLFLCEKDTIQCLICMDRFAFHSERTFNSQIAAISNIQATNIIISLFDGSLLILNDELETLRETKLNYFVTSISTSKYQIVTGSETGEIVYLSSTLDEEKRINVGKYPVTVDGPIDRLVCKCGKRFYVVIDGKPKSLPPDFLALNWYAKNSNLALLKSPNKNVAAALLTFHFTDVKLGFHNRILFEFNSKVDRVLACRAYNTFVASLRKPAALFWSRGENIVNLELGEIVHAMAEWKCNFKDKMYTFWIVGTERPAALARLLIFSQYKSGDTLKINTVISKTFGNPVRSVCAVSPTLAVFAFPDSINGISLSSGALTRKFEFKSPLPGIVEIAATKSHIVCLTDRRGFLCLSLKGEADVEVMCIIRRPLLGGRIRVVDDYIIVSDRIGKLQFFSVKGEFRKELSLLAPITEMFVTKMKLFVCTITGQMLIVSIDSSEINESDVSSLFAFGHSAFSLEE